MSIITFTYCVPDLQFDVLIVDLDGPCTKLDPDSQIVLLPEALVCELEKQTGLAHTYNRLFSVINSGFADFARMSSKRDRKPSLAGFWYNFFYITYLYLQ